MGASDNKPQGGISPIGSFLIVASVFATLVAIAVPAITVKIPLQRENASAAKAHTLAVAAFNYCNDNEVYPFGSSSTAIFQKLYNGQYLVKPADVFLTPHGGKIFYPVSDQPVQLKPENVSWDFVTRDTTGLTTDDPRELPFLFSDIEAEPGWSKGLNSVTVTSSAAWATDGVTICTMDQEARFLRPSPGQTEVSLTTSETSNPRPE